MAAEMKLICCYLAWDRITIPLTRGKILESLEFTMFCRGSNSEQNRVQRLHSGWGFLYNRL